MLSVGPTRDDRWSDMGGRLLRLLLAAGLGAPLAAAALGRRLATPFGMPLMLLAGVMGLFAIGYAAWRIRRSPSRAPLRVGVDALALAVLAATFALIIDHAANGFYTQEVLADAMAVLLLLHLAGATLRAVGRNRQRGEPASMQFADGLTTAMALFVGCFWVFALIGFHEPAGILLILAGLFGGIVMLARLPSAFINERVLFRDWRRTRRLGRSASTRHEGSHARSS